MFERQTASKSAEKEGLVFLPTSSLSPLLLFSLTTVSLPAPASRNKCICPFFYCIIGPLGIICPKLIEQHASVTCFGLINKMILRIFTSYCLTKDCAYAVQCLLGLDLLGSVASRLSVCERPEDLNLSFQSPLTHLANSGLYCCLLLAHAHNLKFSFKHLFAIHIQLFGRLSQMNSLHNPV